MRVLVTGGAGYVGSVLVPTLLSAGHQVRVLDNLMHGGESLLGVWSEPGFQLVRGDVRDADSRTAAVTGMDAIVHLAAIVGDPACAREPELARAVNLDASLALLDDATRLGVGRFVLASTCSNYGRMPEADGYVDEQSPLAPVSLYAQTKVAAEDALGHLEPASGIAATALRFATVFGVSPRMRFDLTVNEFTRTLLLDGRLVVFGEQFWRPYVHVRDVARAVALVLAAPVGHIAGEVFNVGDTTQNFQKQQIVELVRAHAPGAIIEYVHRDEDPRDYRVSFEKLRRRLGFRVTVPVADGIDEVARLVRAGIGVEAAAMAGAA